MTYEQLVELSCYLVACLGFSTGLAFWIYFFTVAMRDK